MSTLGKNIQLLRKKNKLTQEELSKYLGCERVMLSYYETDTRQPNLDTLIKLSDVFGVELDDLLDESDCKLEENLALAFRTESMSVDNLNEIAMFKKIIKNYIKMDNLVKEYGLHNRS
ncbi:MAG: helix-turn-helix transcriptional regulator [Asgard group archaeon]|nr:helix-turn-helix transcriptional regulator [Asgard group archaeon]